MATHISSSSSLTVERIRTIEAQCFPLDMRIRPEDLDFIVQHQCFVLHEAVGFLTYLPIDPSFSDDPDFRESKMVDLYCHASRTLFIFGIAVVPSSQRKSIAGELLHALPDADCILTEAVSPSGVAFFERNGFHVMHATADGLLMRKLAMPAAKSA
jgi:GNAT superfamily N-acetyltransferase